MLMRLFFATDVHGSERCWKKFVNAANFYKADALILGGDMTGKALFLIVHEKDGSYTADYLDNKVVVKSSEELQELEQQITNRGYYPFVIERKELDELRTDEKRLEEWVDKTFRELIKARLMKWNEIAEKQLSKSNKKCFVCPGNDDMFEIDELINTLSRFQHAEGKVINLDDQHAIISSGWSNRTPWKTFREYDEDALLNYLEKISSGVTDFSKVVLSAHVPPYRSGLDDAPELDPTNLKPKYAAKATVPVGSTAVRSFIEKHQPLLSLHGHIHECKAVAKIGRTFCVNPGSQYEQGILTGAVIDLEKDKIARYFLTPG